MIVPNKIVIYDGNIIINAGKRFGRWFKAIEEKLISVFITISCKIMETLLFS